MPFTKAGLREACPDNWEDAGNTFEAILVEASNSYVFDVDDEFVSEIAATEIDETGYARVELASLTTTWDAANDRWRLVCSSMDFGAIEAGGSVVGMWISRVVTDDSDSVLWCYEEFASPVATDGNTFTVTVGAEGAARVA